MLEDLVQVIEMLKQRIHDHSPTLRENETRTRMALIDPLLTVLGWDVSNPALVTPEYRVDVGWADYALRGVGNTPATVIEAKRLGSIVENHLDQAVGYCIQQGVAYAGVTDGSHWRLYRTFEPVPMADKIVLDVNIENTPAHQCALQMLLLWRPNLASGQPIPANEPILVNNTAFTEPQESAAPSPAPLPPAALPTSGDGWVPFSTFVRQDGADVPPAIRFPDGSVVNGQRYWRELPTKTAAWLWFSGALNQSNVPVESSNRRYIVNTQPTHQNGNAFTGTNTRVEGTPLHIETNISAGTALDHTKKLLDHCGIPHAHVQLQVGE